MIAAPPADCLRCREEHVGHQYAHARAWVGFNQEEHRLTGFRSLLDTQRREDAVVDGVIQEQDFRRFNENGRQWQQVVRHHHVYARRQQLGEHLHQRPDAEEGQDRQQHADDAGGEVVHQHFKAAFDLAVHPAVKVLDSPAAQRAGDHRAEEHRHVGANDDAHGGDGADDAAAIAAHQPPAGITDQQRQQVGDHRADQLG